MNGVDIIVIVLSDDIAIRASNDVKHKRGYY